jgi:hypothetical protein
MLDGIELNVSWRSLTLDLDAEAEAITLCG